MEVRHERRNGASITLLCPTTKPFIDEEEGGYLVLPSLPSSFPPKGESVYEDFGRELESPAFGLAMSVVRSSAHPTMHQSPTTARDNSNHQVDQVSLSQSSHALIDH